MHLAFSLKCYFLLAGILFAGSLQAQHERWVLDGQIIYDAELQQSERSSMVNRWVKQKIANGFIFAGVDSIKSEVDTLIYYLHLGTHYKVSQSFFLSKDSTRYKTDKIHLAKRLHHYLDNGYPFARIQVDSVRINGDLICLFNQIQPGPFLTYDSIVFLQTIKSKNQFIARSLRLSYGMPYSETDYRLIASRIEAMPYLSLKNPTDIAFSGGKATVYLNLEEKKINSFDGIVGLQNNSQTNQAELTGILELSLQNLLQSGKQFYLKWNRFAFASQQIQTRYYHPFIFKSPLGLDASFQLFRQDSSFVNRQVDLNLITGLAGTLQIGFSFTDELSNVMSSISDQGRLSFKNQWYGLMFFNRNQGFMIQSPGNQWSFFSKMMLGNKKLLAGTENSIVNFKFDLDLQLQRMFGNSKSFFFQFRSGAIINEQLVENEYFRLGGFKTIRGFNEQQFYSPYYFLQTTSFRFFTSDKSYFTLFNDSLVSTGESNFLVNSIIRSSLGTGFSITVANGLFTFIFAQPIISDSPVSLLDARIHFGYTARF